MLERDKKNVPEVLIRVRNHTEVTFSVLAVVIITLLGTGMQKKINSECYGIIII